MAMQSQTSGVDDVHRLLSLFPQDAQLNVMIIRGDAKRDVEVVAR